MSGNINDTDVELIKMQMKEMFDDIDTMIENDIKPQDDEVFLQKKHAHLYETSKSLFNYILIQYPKNSFDKKYFETTIHKMLESILEIQKSKVTQHDASVNIGTHLAKKYFPK